jgi:hypothetical protein
MVSPLKRLEQYTERQRQEVLVLTVRVAAAIDGTTDGGTTDDGTTDGGTTDGGTADDDTTDDDTTDDDTTDEIMIFRGFSSSLVRPTAWDPDVDVLPEGADIVAIARLQAPYDPQNPQYLEQNLTWETMQLRLETLGL